MKKNILILFFIFMVVFGCNDKDQNNKRSLATMGKLTIGVDESLQPFVDDEIRTFSFLYTKAYITPLYLPEKQVVEKLLANEIQTGLICRDLQEDEVKFLKSNYQHIPTTFKLAEDEIVAVVNNENPVNTISYNEIRDILSGKITDWRKLNPALKRNSPIMVIMTGSSSINRYFSSLNNTFSSVSIYALDTTTEVIEYVKNSVFALGIMGGSWFYQKGDKYSDVKLLSYQQDNLQNNNQAKGLYREVYAVTHEPFTGLGSGFITFMASQKGQLILLKAGMTPYKPIKREIEISGSYQVW